MSYKPSQPARSSAPRIAGTPATPSPGRTRSAQPRVGSRQSFTCTAAMRCAWRSISSKRSGVFHRCQTSNRMPSAGDPISSTTAAASPSVLRIDQLSMPSLLERLERDAAGRVARLRPRPRAAPASAVARSPGPRDAGDGRTARRARAGGATAGSRRCARAAPPARAGTAAAGSTAPPALRWPSRGRSRGRARAPRRRGRRRASAPRCRCRRGPRRGTRGRRPRSSP